jgi:hypothetical protein
VIVGREELETPDMTENNLGVPLGDLRNVRLTSLRKA